MTQAQETRRLTGAFRGIVLKRTEAGLLTVDISSLSGLDVTIVTTGGRILTPAEVRTNKAQIISASVDKRAYNIGDVLPDGWVVGPASPTTGRPISIEPVYGALEGYQTWYAGEDHAKKLRDQGHAGARQPYDEELSALYNDVVKVGPRNQNAQFNTSVSEPYGLYWSSTGYNYTLSSAYEYRSARLQHFNNGERGWYFKKSDYARVRCVRDEPGIVLLGEKGKALYSPEP